MSEFRFNFQDLAPDLEDTKNPGLTIAQNVVHETEGYKAVHLGSAGSFSTTGALGASNATVTALIAKPVGAQSDLFCAWLANDTLHVGINGITSPTSATGHPLSFGTAGPTQEITVFDVTEFADKIFFVVSAQQDEVVPSNTSTLTTSGFVDY